MGGCVEGETYVHWNIQQLVAFIMHGLSVWRRVRRRNIGVLHHASTSVRASSLFWLVVNARQEVRDLTSLISALPENLS